MADPDMERALTPLELWTALARALRARRVPTLTANEIINQAYPGLWLAASMEHAQQCDQAPHPTR